MTRKRKVATAAGAATIKGVGFTRASLGIPAMGAIPAGERKARIEASPSFHGGKARNSVVRPMSAEGQSMAGTGLRWLTHREQRRPSLPIPVHPPDPATLRAEGQRLRATWLGHSTVLLEIDGHLLITDPAFGPRAAPVSWAGPRRFQEVPLDIDQLPPLDAVILSHDHYDHLDHGTIVALAKTGVRFLAPLGVGAHLESWGVEPARITELDWWEDTKVGDLRLVCTPAHHFSGRSLADRDRTLWASWAVLGPKHRAWFSGDTGPLDDAEDIAQRYGPFDLAMIEIGAYDPAWAAVHLGPDAALELHRQLGGRALLPIHWGTFELALHAWDQPIVRLLELAGDQGTDLLVPLPGQTIVPGASYIADFWRRTRTTGEE